MSSEIQVAEMEMMIKLCKGQPTKVRLSLLQANDVAENVLFMNMMSADQFNELRLVTWDEANDLKKVALIATTRTRTIYYDSNHFTTYAVGTAAMDENAEYHAIRDMLTKLQEKMNTFMPSIIKHAVVKVLRHGESPVVSEKALETQGQSLIVGQTVTLESGDESDVPFLEDVKIANDKLVAGKVEIPDDHSDSDFC